MTPFSKAPAVMQQHLQAAADFIQQQQSANGYLPWFREGKCDPWDMTEAAIGLTIAGRYPQALATYQWLAKNQLEDGSWFAHYQDQLPQDTHHRETHFVAYIATGVWHYFLTTRDKKFLTDFFPVVEKAINFVLQHQASSGEIYWAVNERGESQKDALITACASVYKSLECALQIATALEKERPDWQKARQKLGHCLRYQPQCFDRTWESKARFSMDWFYPVIAGVYSRREAQQRLQKRWDIFVEPGVGCRCVSDEPWMTVAESCELTLALAATGELEKAEAIFAPLHRWQDTDGGYWTGFNFRDGVIWPREKTTWTAAAVLMAADALYQLTPASSLFQVK